MVSCQLKDIQTHHTCEEQAHNSFIRDQKYLITAKEISMILLKHNDLKDLQ